MKWKKYKSIEHEDGELNTWCIGRAMGWTWSMDNWNRVASCKRSNRRLLEKVFESKPIRRGGKIPFQQPKYSLELLQQHRTHVFPEQQQLHNSSCFPQPLYLKKIKQHGPGTSNEERERRLGKTVPQNTERIGNYDRCTKINEGHQEIGRRS